MKSILNRRITFLGLAAVIAALATFNFSGTALAYTADDPAVVYSCFDTNEDGSFVTETDNETGDVNLVPCEINHGDNAWMLTSSALVLMMTPAGLAIFYGGLSRQKNAVNTLHMVFITTGIIAVQWALWGYSLAFGPDAGGYGFIGDFRWAGLQNVLDDVPSIAYGGIDGTTIPHQTYMIFQMMFAIITPALIVGSSGRKDEVQRIHHIHSYLGNIRL